MDELTFEGNALYNAALFAIEMESTTGAIIDMKVRDLDEANRALDVYRTDKSFLQDRFVEKKQSYDSWDQVSYVANYALSAGMVLGGSPLFMASGAIGLFRQISYDVHLIDPNTAFDTISKMAQLATCVSGLFTETLRLTLPEAVKNASAALTTAGAAAGLVAQVGMAIHQNQLNELRAQLKEIDDQVTMLKMAERAPLLSQASATIEMMAQDTQTLSHIPELYNAN